MPIKRSEPLYFFIDQRDKHQDAVYDSYFLRKQRIEFYLLTSLGTQSMHWWLPKNSQILPGGRAISLGWNVFAIKTHFSSNISKLKIIQESNKEFEKTLDQFKRLTEGCKGISGWSGAYGTNDFFKNDIDNILSQATHILDTKISTFKNDPPYFKHYTGCEYYTSQQNQFSSDDIAKNPIFDAYCKANQNQNQHESDFLNQLEEIFDCKDDSVWRPIRNDKRRGWVIYNDYINPFILFSLTPKNEPIMSHKGGYYPVKTLMKYKDQHKFHLSVFDGLLPLWNGDIANHNHDVWLTENMSFSEHAKLDTPVLSWLGRYDSIPYVDWKQLKDKNVNYVLLSEDDEHIKTAAAVLNVLKNIAKRIDFFGYYTVYRPGPFGKDKVIDKANELMPLFRRQQCKIDDIASLQSPIRLYDGKKTSEKKNEAFTVITDTVIKERPPLQSPFPLADGSISLLYSEPGVGKTWFSLCFAYAVSLEKPFCAKWKAKRKQAVLYIDGEMGEAGLQDRLQYIERMYDVKVSDNKQFHCISLNLADIDLSTIEGQHVINSYIFDKIYNDGEKELLIVIDNVLSVTNYSDHSAHWNNLFSWIKDLRDRNNVTVLLIHHANKGGKQRGTGIKPIVVDNVIRINRIDNRSRKIDFEVIFEKHRYLRENMPDEFHLSLKLSGKKQHWIDHGTYSTEKDSELLDKLLRKHLDDKPLPVNEIMDQTGYSRPSVYARLRALKQDAVD